MCLKFVKKKKQRPKWIYTKYNIIPLKVITTHRVSSEMLFEDVNMFEVNLPFTLHHHLTSTPQL